MTGIDKAIEVAGSQRALAEKLGVAQQHVSYWRRNRVPAERVREICEAVGGQVQPHDLRPDLYEAAA